MSSIAGVPEAFMASVQHLKRLDGARLLTALPSFVELLRGDLRLRSISEGLLRELESRTNRFAAHDSESIETLRVAWNEHSPWILELWAAGSANRSTAVSEVMGSPSDFETFLVARSHQIPSFREPSSDESATGALVAKLQFWLGAVRESASTLRPEALGRLERTLGLLREQHARAYRQYLLDGTTHPGASIFRLYRTADALLPAVVGWDPNDEVPVLLEKAARWWLESQVSLAVFPEDERDRSRLDGYVEQVRRDLALVEVEVLKRFALERGCALGVTRDSMSKSEQANIFVSYCHSDLGWLKRIQVHLRPLVRKDGLVLWDDTKLQPGADWRADIQEAVRRADVAVLLISADFLASDFVATDELPPILAAAAERGTKVVPVIVGPSLFSQLPELSKFQAINAPDRPLSSMESHEAEGTLLRLALSLREHLRPTATTGKVPEVAAQVPSADHRERILALIERLQAKQSTLSSCISDALGIAISTKDARLRKLCERELSGHGEAATVGLQPIDENAEDVTHRVVQFYVSIETEVNIDYFGSGEAAISWIQSNPKQFAPMKFLFPKAIAEVERDASRSTPERLLRIKVPAGSLVPTTAIPDAPVFLYARGDALSDIVEGLRATVTGILLQRLKP